MGRNETIDLAKAICIIFVVIGHYIPNNSPQWYLTLNEIIYSFHMPLFLFASGYIYISTLKQCSYGAFIVKKIKRLMVPYLSTSVIVIALKLLTQAISNVQIDNPVDVGAFLKMLYYPEAGYYLWFVWALWWMFVITPFFRTRVQRNILFAVALIVAYIPVSFTNVFCLDELRRMYVFFLLGVFVYENDMVGYIRKIPSAVIYLSFIMLEVLYVSGICSDIIVWILPYFGIATVLLLSKSIADSRFKRVRIILGTVAASSYIIYLFHTTFEGFVKSSFVMVPSLADVTNNFTFGVGALAVILVGILLPIALHKFVLNKNKVLKFLFGLK